jgi:hypothetical protein
MSRPIAYNTPALAVNGSITNEDKVISYVVDGRGNDYYNGYADRLWVPSADGAAPIVFVTDTYTRGYEGDPLLSVPLFFACAGTSSAAILYTANRLPGSPGNYTDANAALVDLNKTLGYFILESNDPFQGINATDMAMDLDASKMLSYPQTGVSWFDLSGNGRNSTLVNGPVWNSNGWIEFDGADDRSTTSFGFLSNSESHEAWIYSKGNVSTYNMFMGIILPYYGFFTGNTFIVQDYVGGAQVGYYTGTLSLNRWYHFLSTRSYNGTNTTLTTYINGTLSAQQTFSGAPSIAGGTWAIGNWDAPSAGASYPFYGDISRVNFYTRALPISEVKQNYFGSPIVTDGLVFAVDANNIVSYPKSGTAWYNLTGSVASATLTNGPIFSNTNGGIINFDGVDDYAVTSNFPSLSNWSTEMWLNPNIYTTAQRVILDVNLGIRFEISNGFFNSHFGDGVGWIYTNLPSTTQIAPNTWFHVIVTVQSGGQAKVYVNGVLENTINIGSGTTPSVPLYIARFTGAGGYEFNGKIANTRIYSKALTSSEVQQNYQAEQYRFEGPQGPVTNGLVLYLDAGNLDSYPGTGTTWYTLAGSNNGTLNNGVGFNQTNGGVLIFDGVDDYATAGNFFTYQAFTIDLWIKPASSQTTYADIIDNNHTGAQNWVCQQNVSNLNEYNFVVFGSAGQQSATGLFTLTSNTWVNLTFTYDGDKVRGYNNGTLFATGASLGTTINYVSQTFNIGRWDSGGRNWNGQYSVVQSYNRVLSSTEITQNYNFFKGRFGL